MNHPTPEDWMAHLYGETPAARGADLDSHLRRCPACAARVKSWRAGLGALEDWKLPSPRRAHHAGPFIRWAAAAAIVLALGFIGGRFSGDARSARAAMQQEFESRLALAREELRAATATETQRALESFAQSMEEKRAGDATALLAALRQVDARHAATFARLRRDLDTVAVVADGRLSDTQEQLYQLASAHRPEDPLRPGTE